MRGPLLVAVLLSFGCTTHAPCRFGTVLVHVTFDDTAAQADELTVNLALDSGATDQKTVPHEPNQRTSTIEIDFSGSYPAGRTLTVTITATLGGQPIGQGSHVPGVALGDSCVTLAIDVTGGGTGWDGAVDLSGDLAGISCSNHIRDGDETDVDCGGTLCPSCSTGLVCAADGDCTSGICSAQKLCVTLAAQCADGVKNGSETDVDCGGLCVACGNGKGCGSGSDCTSMVCNLTTRSCVATECEDGTKDGAETDVDCGGGTCLVCAAGKTCARDNDCTTAFCHGTTRVCASPPPSCTGLAADCGASGNESCCASPLVAGGTYYRSYDLAGDGYSGNTSSPATLSDFRLDRFEVTVGRFRAFVDAGLGTQASPPPVGAGARTLNGTPDTGGWDASWNTQIRTDTTALRLALNCGGSVQTWTDTPGANEDKPISCITWYEAFAFCAWDGGFMPTEAEWNYAATGGSEQRAYPWSNPASSTTIDCTYANYSGCVGQPGTVGAYSPKGDGRWAQSDLAGNLDEWNLDAHGTYPVPCNDCVNFQPSPSPACRGGAYDEFAADLRTGGRGYIFGPATIGDFGVRCGRPK